MRGTVAGALVTLWILLITALSFGDGMADSRMRFNPWSLDPVAVGTAESRTVDGLTGFPRATDSLKQSDGGKLLFQSAPVSAVQAEEGDSGTGSSRLRIQEPATLVFLGVGFLVLAGYGRRLTHRTRK